MMLAVPVRCYGPTIFVLLLRYCTTFWCCCLGAAFISSKITGRTNVPSTPSANCCDSSSRQLGIRSSNSIIQPFVRTPVNNTEKFLARNPYWILLVDDEEAIRQSVGDFLFDAGYQITACADADSAMEVLRSCTSQSPSNNNNNTSMIRTTMPGCALLDIRMPGGPDGIELLQWIRSTPEVQRLPVILLTAKGMTVDRISGYSAGCDFYLAKPFVPEELLSIVDAAVVQKPPSALEDVLAQVNHIKAQLRTLDTRSSSKGTTAENYVYLTPSERNVLELLCDGLTNQEISDIRNTTNITVQRHLKNIYTKSQTKTRSQLVKWAIQNGFVPVKPPIIP